MNPMRFEFATTGRILFGSGTAKEIPDIARFLESPELRAAVGAALAGAPTKSGRKKRSRR